ncbi:unnamed protein product, partial [Phaeothamnion confervicola]
RLLEGGGQPYVPIKTTWRLNERHYGALQGKSKAETEAQLGPIVREWRRSFSARPPPMEPNHPHWPLIADDPRYRGVDIPRCESLDDTVRRVWSYWEGEICRDLGAGKSVLVMAHANTIRSLVKVLDDVSEEKIKAVKIPTGRPFVYRLGPDFRPVGEPDANGFRGKFISDLMTAGAAVCVGDLEWRLGRCEELMRENPLVVPEDCY